MVYKHVRQEGTWQPFNYMWSSCWSHWFLLSVKKTSVFTYHNMKYFPIHFPLTNNMLVLKCLWDYKVKPHEKSSTGCKAGMHQRDHGSFLSCQTNLWCQRRDRETCAMFSSLALLTCFCSMLHSQCKQYSPCGWECSKPASRLHRNATCYPGYWGFMAC